MKEHYIKQHPLIDWVNKEFKKAEARHDLVGMNYCNAFLQQLVIADVKEIEK